MTIIEKTKQAFRHLFIKTLEILSNTKYVDHHTYKDTIESHPPLSFMKYTPSKILSGQFVAEVEAEVKQIESIHQDYFIIWTGILIKKPKRYIYTLIDEDQFKCEMTCRMKLKEFRLNNKWYCVGEAYPSVFELSHPIRFDNNPNATIQYKRMTFDFTPIECVYNKSFLGFERFEDISTEKLEAVYKDMFLNFYNWLKVKDINEFKVEVKDND